MIGCERQGNMPELTMIEQVDIAITAWAEWQRQTASPAASGYSGRTTIAKLMEEGAGAAGGGYGQAASDMPPLVEIVEIAIIALPVQQKRAIKLKFCHPDLRDVDRAKAMRMALGSYQREVDRARWFIGGRIF